MDKTTAIKRKIKKHLFFGKMLSCTDLSVLIDKSLPITIKLLKELITDDEVVELGYAASTGGRRPQLYSLKPNTDFIVTVAMDQLITKIGIMNMEHEFVMPFERFDLPLTDNPDSLASLAAIIDRFITDSGISRDKMIGVGIGMPGFIDVEKGINHSFLRTRDNSSIVDFIEKYLGIPSFIDNDSSLIALAELKFGAGRKKRNCMVINLSWGVGLGLILNGELFRGHNGFAGEFSHIPMFTNDKLCSCGKSGCLETEASLLVIVEKAKRGIKDGRVSTLDISDASNNEDICEAIIKSALKGDKFCVELLSQVGYTIGRGVAILIHILNPELIILSGRGSTAGKLWRAPIQQALNEHCIPRLAEYTEIEISTMGFEGELYGAAALVMDNYDKIKPKRLSHKSS